MTADPGTLVLLIRHAETDAVGRRLAGRAIDDGLNARGRAQAAALARELSGVPVTALYASPRRRARETAAPLATVFNLDTAIDPALDEVDFGAWTGLGFAALAGHDEWQRYNARRETAEIPGGESPQRTLSRITRALRDLHRRHPRAVIAAVTHAEIVRYALLLARSRPLDEWHTVDVPPAAVVRLSCSDSGVREAQVPAPTA